MKLSSQSRFLGGFTSLRKNLRQEVDGPLIPRVKQLEIHSLWTETRSGPCPDHVFLILKVGRLP